MENNPTTQQVQQQLKERCDKERAAGQVCFIHHILSTVEAPPGYFLTGFIDHDTDPVELGIEWHRDEHNNLDLFVELIGNTLVNEPNLSWEAITTLANKVNGEYKVHHAYEEWHGSPHRHLYITRLVAAIATELTGNSDLDTMDAVRWLLAVEEDFHFHSPVTPERVLTAWNALHGQPATQ